MTALGWVELLAGIALSLATLYDLFHSVVLPRPAINRYIFVRSGFRATWKAWRWIGRRVSHAARREGWLAAFGPFAVIGMFGTWAAAFILGYALILDALRNQVHPALNGFFDALYFSATTLVPLSYGDYVPTALGARLAVIFESATGVGVAALVITLLFSLYTSFQERERLVVTLDAVAGAPPSGLELLETAADRGNRDELVKILLDWREWAAAVLESHLAYPVLCYFRSSHDNEAWLNSFAAVMDAAALLISAVDEDVDSIARLTFTIGNHLVEDLGWFFGFRTSTDPHVDRAEFEEAVRRLRAAGYRVRPMDEAWAQFSKLRAKYAKPLRQMSQLLAITPAAWISERSYVPHEDGRARTPRAHPRKTPVAETTQRH